MKKSITFLVLQISLALVLMNISSLAQNQYILEFDDADDYVRYADDSALDLMDGATDYTLEAWVFPIDTADIYDRIFQRYSSFQLTFWKIDTLLSKASWYLGVHNGTAFQFFNADTTLELNTWNHIAAICNSQENTIKLYVNGVEATDPSYGPYTALALRPSQANDNLYVGNSGGGSGYFGGFIDEVRIKNQAIDPITLPTNTSVLPYVPDANTAILFHFDEGIGDSTLNSASGTMARLGGTGSGDVNQPTFRAWDYPPTSLPLPVELTFFSANVSGSTVGLNWTTATEINNRGFEVQRSADRINFSNITFIPGFGTTTERRNYSFTDNSVTNGKYYYRLKQIDYNGAFAYSDIVEVDVSTPLEFALLQNYPNPFNPSTIISYSVPQSSFVTIKVYDIIGNEVTTLVNGNEQAGKYDVRFDASNLSNGVYMYSIKTDNFTSTKKMILMK
jgi:hypothetical protein